MYLSAQLLNITPKINKQIAVEPMQTKHAKQKATAKDTAHMKSVDASQKLRHRHKSHIRVLRYTRGIYSRDRSAKIKQEHISGASVYGDVVVDC